MTTTAKPLLYSFWRSSCAWRVRIALHLKGIEYVVRPVELKVMGGKGHSDDFSEINPLEKVPALQIGMCITHISASLLDSFMNICVF